MDRMQHRYSSRNGMNAASQSGMAVPSPSVVGRLGAGLVAGITGVVMDPIRGGQNDGMKGFLRGIASGISGVAIKPITHFRASNSLQTTKSTENESKSNNLKTQS